MASGRRAARRTALFLLYQWDVTGRPLASLYEGDVDAYARSLAEAVVERAAELDERITDAAEGWTGGPARRDRTERPPDRRPRARVGRRPRAGRDRRGSRTREALRERRGRPPRQRDPWPDPARPPRYAAPMTAEESLQRAETLLERLEATRARLEATEEPEAALEILGRAVRDRTRGRSRDPAREARGGGRRRCGPLRSCARSSRTRSPS